MSLDLRKRQAMLFNGKRLEARCAARLLGERPACLHLFWDPAFIMPAPWFPPSHCPQMPAHWLDTCHILLLSSKDVYKLVSPFLLWGALVMMLYGIGYSEFAGLEDALVAVKLGHRTMAQAARVAFFAGEVSLNGVSGRASADMPTRMAGPSAACYTLLVHLTNHLSSAVVLSCRIPPRARWHRSSWRLRRRCWNACTRRTCTAAPHCPTAWLTAATTHRQAPSSAPQRTPTSCSARTAASAPTPTTVRPSPAPGTR